MVIPFYIYVLLGILVRCPDIVYTLCLSLLEKTYNLQADTRGDYDELDSDSVSDTETITDAVMERERERERQEELKNTLEDAEKNLKKVAKAIDKDKTLPVNRKHNNRHLNHLKEEFSSYFDKKRGSDITQSLEEVEAMLIEEIDYLKTDIYGDSEDNETDQPDNSDKTDQPENSDDNTNQPEKSDDNTNQPKNKKGLDPLEDIEEEMPSFLDDLD